MAPHLQSMALLGGLPGTARSAFTVAAPPAALSGSSRAPGVLEQELQVESRRRSLAPREHVAGTAAASCCLTALAGVTLGGSRRVARGSRIRVLNSSQPDGAVSGAETKRARSSSVLTEEDKERKERKLRSLEGSVTLGPEGTMDSMDLEAPAAVAGYRYQNYRKELPRAVPFLPDPSYRSFAANVAGDAGFDPLGLCADVKDFVRYREAELKHARIAMVGAIVWPLTETISERISESERYIGRDILAETGGRAFPSDSSGDFVESFIVAVILIGSIFELLVPKGSAIGDLKFDPLRLTEWKAPAVIRSSLPQGRPWAAEAELKHGRLAMVAFAYDVIDEITTGNPVVEDTEYFFHFLDVKFVRWEYWTLQPEFLEAEVFDTEGLQQLAATPP